MILYLCKPKPTAIDTRTDRTPTHTPPKSAAPKGVPPRNVPPRNVPPRNVPPKPNNIFLVSGNVSPEIRFVINKPIYTIGRQKESVDGVIPNQKTVGRIHCKIINMNGEYFIQDMDSMNGTYVNNKRLVGNQKVKIEKGDLIKISKVEFVVR